MDKTDRLRDYGLAFLLYEQGLGICGYELIRELFIFVKLILNSYLQLQSCIYQLKLNDEDYYLLFIMLKKYLCISKLSLSSGWKAVTS